MNNHTFETSRKVQASHPWLPNKTLILMLDLSSSPILMLQILRDRECIYRIYMKESNWDLYIISRGASSQIAWSLSLFCILSSICQLHQLAYHNGNIFCTEKGNMQLRPERV
jgi:hypothetical protein